MKGLLIACIVDRITTLKDKSVNITLNTQELTPSRAAEIFQLMNSLASVYISPSEITSRELSQVDAIEPEMPGKRPSERMRNVLYVCWKNNKEGFESFDPYYQAKMERYIDELKNNLPDRH